VLAVAFVGARAGGQAAEEKECHMAAAEGWRPAASSGGSRPAPIASRFCRPQSGGQCLAPSCCGLGGPLGRGRADRGTPETRGGLDERRRTEMEGGKESQKHDSRFRSYPSLL
jgi:hypothetical protein